ncbi:MAG: Hsp33 family molecular chaperone HslO [Legionellales bacterium]|nr:Hsp33 family molecular chaperone HslO [Legionellales bacterium]
MNSRDGLQRFLFENACVSGQLAHLNVSYQAIINQRAYPAAVKKMLGEAMISCLLLAGSLKFEGKLSLQFKGDKRLPLLVVQCDHQLHLRGMASFQEGLSDRAYSDAFLGGHMSLTLHQPGQIQPYQSVVPIQSAQMSENLTQYFSLSEQIASRVWLATSDDNAAGLLLRLMPSDNLFEQERSWEEAVMLAQTVSSEELLTLDNQILLHRLYDEITIRLFDDQLACFECTCNEHKIKQVLTLLGEEDIKNVLMTRGKIEINCDFCNKKYCFDVIDAAMIFHDYKKGLLDPSSE